MRGAWTGLQCDLLSGVEALWAECARRQSEVAQASARTLQRLFGGRLVLEIAQLQHDWLTSTVRRTATSIDQWASQGVARMGETAVSAGRAVAAANESMAQLPAEREAAE